MSLTDTLIGLRLTRQLATTCEGLRVELQRIADALEGRSRARATADDSATPTAQDVRDAAPISNADSARLETYRSGYLRSNGYDPTPEECLAWLDGEPP